MESMSAVVVDMTTSTTKTSISSLSRGSLSLLQMLLLNAVVCGVEICACAGFTYVPPLLLKAGYTEENLGLILGLGPLLGFFLVPVIGRASDRCYSHFGRRRPFILGLAILLVVSLYLIPFGEYFASLLVPNPVVSRRIGIWGLTAGVVLLDFTTQACLTPCEALLNDAACESEQSEKIFTIYSLMVSLGGIIGYLLTAIDWSNNAMGQYFGGQEASVFSILIVMFTMMLAATLLIAQEVPLSNPAMTSNTSMVSSTPTAASTDPSSSSLAAVSATPLLSELSASPSSSPRPHIAHESGYESSNYSSGDEGQGKTNGKRLPRSIRGLGDAHSPAAAFSVMPSFLARIFRRGVSRLGHSCPRICRFLSQLVSCVVWLVKQVFPKQLMELFQIPAVLKLLAVADFCSWTAIMGFNIYYTDYVGQVVYGGNPNAPADSPEGRAYDDGVRIASWGLLFHCICSAVLSFFIERLTAAYGYKTTFTLGMVTFVGAMMGMVLIRHIVFVNLMAAITGFAYATITTIPFMLISKYHANKKVYFRDLPSATLSDSERGIGADMAILDWSYFLSQVVLTAAMGTIVHVTGTLISYMVTAGAMGILAIYYIGHIVENEPQARRCVMDATDKMPDARR
ncbi:solute carrier family 45 member 3 [Aplysia californica]|uniref:Solute carrier family 45 member 3 n=1 Tax=Aplysia californica TaxID=6500 RepID=A0ABM1A9M4_APLCA|nr:solute carrier family 45 member 3 [Aplysia californica]XP_012943466.1 solute carrier family 45 member 3 [Aplysia californica]